MKPPSVFPTVSACRWLWESSPGVLLRAHTSYLLTLAPVALAMVPLPLFRFARTRLHLPRLPLHWLGFFAKLQPGHLLGRSCRKGHRIDNSGFPSLWHATLLAVPRALSEVVGLRQSRLSFRSLRCLGTEVPSLPVRYSVLCYYGPLRLPLSPLHPLAGLALGPCLPMSSGLPCSYEFPLCSCPRHYSGGLPWDLFRSLCPFPWTRVLPSRCQPSPNLNGLGVHIALFEACSTFTRVTA
jgi:hypothetical protein